MRRAVLGLVLVAVGCSTTSTIRYRDGVEEEVNIVGGDKKTIAVRSAGRESVIDRSEIADIDYPGNAVGTLGVWIIADSTVAAAFALGLCNGDFGCAAPSLLGLPVGIALAAEGFSRWSDAKKRARTEHAGSPGTRTDSFRLPEEAATFPQLDLAQVPVACHALVQADRMSLVSHVTAASTEPECTLTRGETKRAPSENELFRLARFHGKADSARMIVRDVTGNEWSTSCVCLAPK